MHARLIVTLLIGTAIGLGIAHVGMPQNVAAQQVKQTKWEYYVTVLPAYNPDDCTKAMNNLAKDRWEFVGLVGVGNTNITGSTNPTAAFRREKQ